MNNFSEVKFHESGADMILIDKIIFEIFNKINEKNSSIWGLIGWIGFEQKTVYYDKRDRVFGQSGWTTRKKIKAAIDSLVSFSYAPIKIISIIGFVLSLISFILIILFIINNYTDGLIWGVTIQGYASTIILILFLGGFQIFPLGLIGEFILRILDQEQT